MQPPSASPCRGGVSWQGILLAVSLLTFWNPHPTAQLTIEPVPFDAAVETDVLLLVHNASQNTIGYYWFKGNTTEDSREIISYSILTQKINTGPAFSGRETLYTNGSLLFMNVTKEDTGFYTLRTLNNELRPELATGEIRVHGWPWVSSEKLPKPNITINNSQPMEGEDSLALTCEPEISYATYLWKINSQTITDGDRLKLSNNNRTLTLFSVTRNDTGPYECETQNPVSASRRDPLTLNISCELGHLVPLGSKYTDPLSWAPGLAVPFTPGTSRQVQPWAMNRRGGLVVPWGGLESATWDREAGECHRLISVNKGVWLRLSANGPDAPIINPPDSHIRPGTNLNLSCHADSNPPAQFSWSFNGRPLESTQELSIPNLSTNNSGSYVCVAHNSVTNLHRTTTKNISISGKWTREHSIKCWVEP
uniref:Ig-like domain-containing protein n=1 Tax=Spermophilus dauricus TaxID=99837 RepID=A0A8C9QKG5_SPEDA